ncbi:MAG: hypothetical protein IT319_01430 [Anaerolineae bacterium]|nr:hypothetical protein [Anaerolineae bacterium]
MRRLRLLLLAVFALLITGAFVFTHAQESPASCPALIEQALNAIGDNCGGLGRNSACYGYQFVDATFTQATAPEFFTQPSDRADLVSLKSIGTTPLDTLLDQWGIALLSLQANLPDTLPGQNTVFMLLGDSEVENAVDPADVFPGGAVVDVTTRVAAGLFYRPDATDDVIGAIPAGVTLTADARTEDSLWLRIVYEGVPGWVTQPVLIAQGAIDTLPVMEPNMQSPMQSFYLRTGITGTECTEAPDSLVVQGPVGLTVDINANGADIRLGSTIALRIIPINPELAAQFAALYGDISNIVFLLEVDVIDGQAILNHGTDEEVVVPEGYRTIRCLNDPDSLGLDGVDNDRSVFPACPWLQPERWRPEDYELYDALDGVQLNYTIHMPVPATLTPTPTATFTPRPYVPPPATLVPTEVLPTAVPPNPTNTATVIPFDILTDTPYPNFEVNPTEEYTEEFSR